MPITVTSAEFIGNVARSSLLAADDLAVFLRQLPPECRSEDADKIAREFVRRGKLTKYQAARVYQGRIRGLVLGEYTVLDKIGSGGMGEVFKARHTRMDRIVALKVIPPDAKAVATIIERFRQEIRAAAKLMHPNIVTALDAGNHDGIHYLVMEYVDGKDLSEFLLQHGPLSVELAVDCAIQAAQGLHYAHSRGVVHRDVKPGNLLLSRAGVVKVLDMGLARVFESAAVQSKSNLTVSGGALGTCNYLAPEQAEDAHEVDHRADVYSLGCTLYRMLTGRVPYPCKSPVKTVLAHREAPIPSVCVSRAEVPSALDEVFKKMVAKRPADRYQSMTELIADLRTAVKPVAATTNRPCADGSKDSRDPALEAFFEQTSASDIFVPEMAISSLPDTPMIREEQDSLAVLASDTPRGVGRKRLVLWSAAGATLCVLTTLFVGLAIRVPGEGAAPKETKQTREGQGQNRSSKSSAAYVTILWRERERSGGRIWLDGQEQAIPELTDRTDRDRLKVAVAPGRHKIRIDRPGRGPVERRFLVVEGEDLVIEPLW